MDRFTREDVLATLSRFGVATAERAVPIDTTEEVIVVGHEELAGVDVQALTLALMDVLPHTKVWVIERTPGWVTEPI